MASSDLSVSPISSALAGKTIDLVVSGSIGAIESPRLIRALRRLGAEVRPYLTSGGGQFVTEMALSWSAAYPTQVGFSSTASHIGMNDILVIAPASANFLAQLAHGLCDSAASALAHSYLGQGKPVLLLPNMHDSLMQAPAVQENLEKVRGWLTVISPRAEEGKQKFLDPVKLADFVAHAANTHDQAPRILLTMGTTRGYIDPVRYISNYSSGGLGTEIAVEAYRYGYKTDVICGPCAIQPSCFSTKTDIHTNEELWQACEANLSRGAKAVIMAASVLDFVPESVAGSKISSQTPLSMTLRPTSKIIAALNPNSGVKVGFKLETDLTEKRASQLADTYMKQYNLSLFVVNDMKNVNAYEHQAYIYSQKQQHIRREEGTWSGKSSIAKAIVDHLRQNLQVD